MGRLGEVMIPEVTVVLETSIWAKGAVMLSAITLLFFAMIL